MKYWISPTIKYKTFKMLNDTLSPQDLAPKNHNKIMWEMIKDRRLNCFIDTSRKDDAVFFTIKEIPLKAKMIK